MPERPLLTVVIACLINIAGDLLLVAGFHMGAAGAATATVLAQAVSVIISMAMICRRTLPFAFQRGDIHFDRQLIGKELKLGIPVGLQEFLVGASFLFCFIGYFNGRGKTLFVMLQGLIGAFGVRIPIVWLVSRIPGATLFQIGLGTPASSLVQVTLCLGMFFWMHRKKNIGTR